MRSILTRSFMLILFMLAFATVTACGSTTAPEPMHIVTQKSVPFQQSPPKGPFIQQQIVLDQLSNWCHVEDATVFAALAIGDTVSAGTCQWWPTI